jgi:glycosyltransferase involved in cell wall biosynthesis
VKLVVQQEPELVGLVACVIPAFNAAGSLTAVVEGLRMSVPGATVIVVDDGSSDDTIAVAQRTADVTVALPAHRGKGAALRAGLRRALFLRAGALVTLDADGQHDPAAVPLLLDALADADLVIGARDSGPPMPVWRRLTNRLASLAVSACTGRMIPDSQSGFRAMRPGVADQVAGHMEARQWGDRYEYETAALIHLARQDYRLAFVPVPTMYPNVTSHFHPLRDTARVVKTIAGGFAHSG